MKRLLNLIPARDSVRAILMNVGFSAVRIVVLLWVIRVAGQHLQAAALGLLLLGRRFAYTGASFLQLGLSQTILREVPMTSSPERRRAWAVFAIVVWMGLAAILIPLAFGQRSRIGELIFGASATDPALPLWTIGLMLAAVLHFYAASMLFAVGRIFLSNIVELLNTGGILLMALWLWSENSTAERLLGAQALGTAAVSAIVLVGLIGAMHAAMGAMPWREMSGVLFRYGSPRAVIPFLDLLVLSTGPWLIRHSPAEAGFLVIALSLAQLVQVGIVPIAQVSSVVGARLIGAGDQERVGDAVRLLVAGSLLTAMFSIAVVAPWSPELISLWLGDSVLSAGVTSYFQILVLSFVPLALYYGVKGIIEVAWVVPKNLISLALCLLVQTIAYFLLSLQYPAGVAVAVAVALGFVSLGFSSAVWVREYFPALRYWGGLRALIAAVAACAANYWLRNEFGIAALVPGFIVAGAIGACAIAVRPVPFVTEMYALVARRGAGPS